MRRRVPSLEKLERLTKVRPAMPLSQIIDRVAAQLQKPVRVELAPAASRVSVAAPE